jgi:hypothetical protein
MPLDELLDGNAQSEVHCRKLAQRVIYRHLDAGYRHIITNIGISIPEANMERITLICALVAGYCLHWVHTMDAAIIGIIVPIAVIIVGSAIEAENRND